MKFSHFVELITEKGLRMSFIWKFVIFLVVKDFTGFASTINTDFEIVFLNALFS